MTGALDDGHEARARGTRTGDLEAAKQLLRERGMASGRKARRVTRRPKASSLTRSGTTRKARSSRSAPLLEPVSKNDEFRAFAENVLDAVDESGPEAVESLEDERKELIGKIGENILVRGAARFESGNGEAIAAYVHPPANKIGVLVRRKARPEAARRLAMHIAFAAPRFATRDEVPEDEVAKERRSTRSCPRSSPSRSRRVRRSSRACSASASSPRTCSPSRRGSTSRRRRSRRRSRRKGSKVLEFERYALAE